MSDPARVRAGGPLAVLISGFRDKLNLLGYSPGSAAQQLQMVAHLSKWMLGRDLVVYDLTRGLLDEFFLGRRQNHTNLVTVRSLAVFWGFLAEEGLLPHSDAVITMSADEETLGRFEHYLVAERGLAPTTVENYLNQTRPFLRWRADRTSEGLNTLSINEVNGFLLVRAAEESVGSIRVAVTGLRALLKWLYLVGIINKFMSGAVSPVTYSAFGALPKAFSPAEITALSAQAARAPVTPRRDLCIVMTPSRLGLRAREIAQLRLEDFNWRRGTVLVRGKGSTHDAMPLPADVGAAIADYLENERPASPARHVFLQSRAPHAPLGRAGVSSVIVRLGRRAGISAPLGAHRLRHSAATSVLAAGGTLTEAAQLLRHSAVASTVIYARVNVLALLAVAREWPTPDLPSSAASAGSGLLS